MQDRSSEQPDETADDGLGEGPPDTGVPPVPGPPPGVPDPDGEPPVNLGVMNPD